MNKKTPPSFDIVEGQCAGGLLCPLSRVAVGARVCVKQLAAQPDLCDRLRELGLVEDQELRVLSRQPAFLCQICNARVALSEALADAIWVQPLPESGGAEAAAGAPAPAGSST
ncbi:MAG: ferrous iron transport protein A [Verrucomicrobiae bacterium]|nr:ferrous iron transport protein A [Verrucomicrobiae bacterium]